MAPRINEIDPSRPEYFSQFGQDYWLMNAAFPSLWNGYFVEVGAFQFPNGYMSNTLALETLRDWRGLLIEPNPALCGPLAARKSTLVRTVVSDCKRKACFQFGDRGCNSMIVETGGTEVSTETLTAILKRENAPRVIPFLGIDVEGHEMEVLRGIDFGRYRFGCIIVEANGRDNAMVRFLGEHGYRYLDRLGVDLYFIGRGFVPPKPSEIVPDWGAFSNRASFPGASAPRSENPPA